MDKIYNNTTEPSTSRQSSVRSNVISDNTKPPAYHELQTVIPHPFSSAAYESTPLNLHTDLERLGFILKNINIIECSLKGYIFIGVPLSDFGQITHVVYGNREAEQYEFCCCCCSQDPYLYIPDNFILNLEDHKVVGILCPKCRTGMIKLGIIKETWEDKRIHVCLQCKTVYPKVPRY